ncbi:helix-hairpin-helix domain-containing protein [Marinoscillum sp. MHG1-6]|uniref:ComEA family DNA-binding protein n=1 Tax=Marinoscillum sp. MHG1-6 TaxID=2959627 RepID=UPI002157FC2E|nr:helix-hairpin-helix domain-containing protein [Marinoscillum sp. MHG1-6]
MIYNLKRVFHLVLLLLWFQTTQSQSIEDFNDLAENLFSIQDENVDYEDLYESLLIHYTNPINLNKATREDLDALYILSPVQITSFFDYIQEFGMLLSTYELQNIPHFDLATINLMLPFVTVREKTDNQPFPQRLRDPINHYFLLRFTRNIEAQKGYQSETSNKFIGDPNKVYGRYRLSSPGDFSFGFTFEKDPGESLQWNRQAKGFDFYSGHACLMNKGIIKSMIVGDFQMQFGQGLVFGSGFSLGKGSETITTVKRNSTGIRPYTSVLESSFFRGTATTLQIGRNEITGFYSQLAQDANPVNDSTYSNFEEFINTIQSTGYHRTTRELSSRDQIFERSAGVIFEQRRNPRLKFGAAYLQSQYSKPIQRKPNNYNQFEFTGSHNQVGSIYGSYGWQNSLFFGEVARSSSGGNGIIGGFITSLSPTLDFSLVIRNYDKNFHSFYGNGFGENSRIINEKGIYWGLKFHPSRRHTFAAYYDKFSFPWLKYRTESPSEGFEYLGRYTFQPRKATIIYAQFRQENKQRTYLQDGDNINQLVNTVKRNYLINLDHQLNANLSLKTRLQTSTFRTSKQKSDGYALIQDLTYQYKRLKISGRVAVFDTDYDNRQYTYEKNVLYAFSIPAYNGLGTRTYLLLQYKCNRSLSLWTRYGQYRYYNQDSIGSGSTKIDGNTKSGIEVMMRYKFN